METVARREVKHKKLQLWEEDWILTGNCYWGLLGKSLNIPEPHFLFYTHTKKNQPGELFLGFKIIIYINYVYLYVHISPGEWFSIYKFSFW